MNVFNNEDHTMRGLFPAQLHSLLASLYVKLIQNPGFPAPNTRAL